MKKSILAAAVTFFALSSFAGTQVFTCNEQSIAQIITGNKTSTEGFLKAIADYKKANKDLTEKIYLQNFTREFYDIPAS